MWIYIILTAVIGIILFFTQTGRAILNGILKIAAMCVLLYLIYLWLKFMIEWTSKI